MGGSRCGAVRETARRTGTGNSALKSQRIRPGSHSGRLPELNQTTAKLDSEKATLTPSPEVCPNLADNQPFIPLPQSESPQTAKNSGRFRCQREAVSGETVSFQQVVPLVLRVGQAPRPAADALVGSSGVVECGRARSGGPARIRGSAPQTSWHRATCVRRALHATFSATNPTGLSR